MGRQMNKKIKKKSSWAKSVTKLYQMIYSISFMIVILLMRKFGISFLQFGKHIGI